MPILINLQGETSFYYFQLESKALRAIYTTSVVGIVKAEEFVSTDHIKSIHSICSIRNFMYYRSIKTEGVEFIRRKCLINYLCNVPLKN